MIARGSARRLAPSFKPGTGAFCWHTMGVVWGLALVGMTSSVTSRAEPVDYDASVRSILSQNCFTCHGPDEAAREAGLRLDTREGLLAETDSGGYAVVPGQPDASELLARLTHDDPSLRMPPPETEKSLSPAQIATLRQWIAEGATVTDHWAFRPITRPAVPTIASASDSTGQVIRPSGPIDQFVWEKLAGTPLSPSPLADGRTRLRRATLDLTGLPPSLDEIATFDDESARLGEEMAYARLVDRLLASPAYGEQMGRYWLDAARYGDTHGLHLDNERSMWPYRAWVIDSFNRGQPFDEFTVEQLAGDLLPDPTRGQLIATGFNRCNVTTSEGGAIAEEFRVRYATDRVETLGTVWMGLTVGCAACHSHKFDPISHREFFGLFAYYNNVDENPMDGNALLPPPSVAVPTPEQEARDRDLTDAIALAKADLAAAIAAIDYRDPGPDTLRDPDPVFQEIVWFDDTLPNGAKPGGDAVADAPGGSPWKPITTADGPVRSGQFAWTRTSNGLSQHFFTEAKAGLALSAGDRLFAHVHLDAANPPKAVMLQFNNGSWDHRAFWGDDVIPYGKSGSTKTHLGALPPTGRWVRLEVPIEQVGLKPGETVTGLAFTQFGGTVTSDLGGVITSNPGAARKYRSLSEWISAMSDAPAATLPNELTAIFKKPQNKRSDAERGRLHEHFLTQVHPETRESLAPVVQSITNLTADHEALRKEIPSTLVMREKTTRKPARILERGEYDKPGDEVGPMVPAALPPLTGDDAETRLGLARWLVSDDHPLTARVTVNRFWQRYFGIGLVGTTDDFGRQGERPSHPQLLDWLASQFQAEGWDTKAMQRRLVMTRAYQQASIIRPTEQAFDPDNRLVWRGPRHRLDAEVVRDQALAVSGLLLRPLGGKSVRPYQPGGLWEAVGYTDSNTAKFTQDHGDALYRRSLYTFWKRTAPPPTMAIFDAPSREACTVRRPRTNTPLQALALMNDVQFVEAARHLALRILTEGGDDDSARLSFAMTSVTGRSIKDTEREVLASALASFRETFRADAEAAQSLLAQGESQPVTDVEPSEWAAWTMLASLLLNLSETVTKS